MFAEVNTDSADRIASSAPFCTAQFAYLKKYGLIWFFSDIAILVSPIPAFIHPLPALNNSCRIYACTMLVIYTQIPWFIQTLEAHSGVVDASLLVSKGNMLPNSSSLTGNGIKPDR